MGNIFSQFFFIQAPVITEKNCLDQTGRVFIVTGGYAGVGFELCKILYAHNATVWIAGRSESKAQKAISSIKNSSPNANGQIHFLPLDLADLATIKPAVQIFTAQEQRLDVLVKNAGVMFAPEGSKDAQGNELHIGTNCLGHYLLYQLLLPILTKTAATSPTASVRVLWAASIALHVALPHPEGFLVEDSGCPKVQDAKTNYSVSKVGNVFLARECAKTTRETGIVHATFNPGNLRTELQRHWVGIDHWITDTFLLFPPIYGAYTELWAALTPELTPEKSGAYVYPWGRFGSLPAGVDSSKIAAKFVEWCGNQTEAFV